MRLVLVTEYFTIIWESYPEFVSLRSLFKYMSAIFKIEKKLSWIDWFQEHDEQFYSTEGDVLVGRYLHQEIK